MGLTFKAARVHVLEEYDRIGINDIRWYLPEYWFERFKLDEDPMEIFRLHTDKIRFYTEAIPFLKRLSEKYELITASGIPINLQEIMMGKLRHHFKRFFSSISDMGEIKKTAKFYEMIIDVLQIEPESIVHVGDDYASDYIEAGKIGIKSFYLDRKEVENRRFVLRNLEEFESHLQTQ